jgi:hypothetical protein
MALSLWLASGCAWGPGQGVATLEQAELNLNMRLPTGRLDSTGAWKTNNGTFLQLADNQVTLQDAQFTLLKTEARTGAGTGGTFDPANPPPGYGLCHGGHCHRDDGALVDYADIQAEMNQGPGAPQDTPVLRLQAESPAFAAQINTPVALSFPVCDPHCYLDAGVLSAVRLEVSSLSARGTLRTSPEAAPQPFVLQLPLSGHRWQVRLGPSVVISREGAARHQLQAQLQLPDTLFDDLPWADWQKTASASLQPSAAQLEKTALKENLARARFEARLD